MSFYTWPYAPPPDDAVTSVGVSGDRFTINGRVQHLRGFTDFAGLDVFRRTGQLSPLALQMQKIHHDFVSLSVPALTPRILLMKNKGSLFDLDPREMPDFFSQLEQHASLMNQQRFIPLYVLLADCAANGMSLGYQQDFVGRACDVLKQHVCLVELVNEFNHPAQQVDPLAFSKPDGVCISRGSPTGGDPLPTPDWDWRAPHRRRDYKWLSTIGKDSVAWHEEEGYHGAVLDTEPRAAGDSGNARYTSTADAFALGASCALWDHAALFHCNAGLTSRPLPPGEMNQAICFLRGVMAIPPEP